MKSKAATHVICLIILLFFYNNLMAANAPIINISLANPKSIPFMFIYNKHSGNVCVEKSPHLVKCIIYNKKIRSFILNLSWVNPDNTDKNVNVVLYGKDNQFSFQLHSSLHGTSFTPLQWDGISNINAKLNMGSID